MSKMFTLQTGTVNLDHVQHVTPVQAYGTKPNVVYGFDVLLLERPEPLSQVYDKEDEARQTHTALEHAWSVSKTENLTGADASSVIEPETEPTPTASAKKGKTK